MTVGKMKKPLQTSMYAKMFYTQQPQAVGCQIKEPIFVQIPEDS